MVNQSHEERTLPLPTTLGDPRGTQRGDRILYAVPDALNAGGARPLTPLQGVAGYKRGDVVLGRLVHVENSLAVVELFPDFQVSVEAELMHTAAPDLTDVWVPGEILPFIVLERGETDTEWGLARAEGDHDAVRGGAPWLCTERTETVEQRPGRSSSQTGHRPHPEDRIRAVRAEQDLREARREISRLRSRLATLKANQRKGQDALDLLDADGRRYADPADQFRFEVDLAYARRTSPEEKSSRTMRSWTMGHQFLPSLDACGISRQKVVDVVLDVLLNRANGRDGHVLRTGAAGGSAPHTRPDGSMCWRLALQQSTPSARRLHYWVKPGGEIELSSVRLHDDMRP